MLLHLTPRSPYLVPSAGPLTLHWKVPLLVSSPMFLHHWKGMTSAAQNQSKSIRINPITPFLFSQI